MDSPPEKKYKFDRESNIISIVVEDWKDNQVEQFSEPKRINGYPWRLRLCLAPTNSRRLAVICDKSREAVLWKCDARMRLLSEVNTVKGTFTSWDEPGHDCLVEWGEFPAGFLLEVEIRPADNGESWRHRPTLDALDARDGVLVFGCGESTDANLEEEEFVEDEKKEERREIQVNKESLASQSPYFDRLLNFGTQIDAAEFFVPFGDYEEFSNIMRLLYGLDGASLTDDNVCRVLELAGCFSLKIVQDTVINYLLSTASSLPIKKRLLLSEQYHLTFLRDQLISREHSATQLRELNESSEWGLLSKDTIQALFNKICVRLEKAEN